MCYQIPKYKDMKIHSLGFALVAFIISCLLSCQPGNKKVANLAPNAHQVRAEEVIQTSAYTYVRVSADGRDYWIAISKMDVRTGETYYWSEGSEMREFTSKELKRTFRSIFFIQDFSAEPITLEKQTQVPAQAGQPGKQPAVEHKGISVAKVEGGLSIAELYAKRKSVDGKNVKIRGEVVKFSGGIMNRNWVHIQDGTRDGENFDLTITTNDSVKVGDIVVFEGKAAAGRDFGAGYFYELIIEDARLKK